MSKNFYEMNLTERQKFVTKKTNKQVKKYDGKILPITFSNQMKTSLGHFRKMIRRVNGKKIKLNAVEFRYNNEMLKEATVKSIKDVIKHEVAHYLTNYKYYANDKFTHGHDKEFREVCRIMKVKNNRAVYKNYTLKSEV